MLKIIKDMDRCDVEHTLIQDEQSEKYFIVSSVENFFANETMIFAATPEGDVDNWAGCWSTRPSNHERVLDKIEKGKLTLADFED